MFNLSFVPKKLQVAGEENPTKRNGKISGFRKAANSCVFFVLFFVFCFFARAQEVIGTEAESGFVFVRKPISITIFKFYPVTLRKSVFISGKRS